MITAAKILKLAPMAKDLAIGAGVWSLLLSAEPSGGVDVERVGAWVHLGGYVTALIAGIVVLFKNRGDAKELLKVIVELLKK